MSDMDEGDAETRAPASSELALPDPKTLPTDRLVLALVEWGMNRHMRSSLVSLPEYNKWAIACGDELNFRCPRRTA